MGNPAPDPGPGQIGSVEVDVDVETSSWPSDAIDSERLCQKMAAATYHIIQEAGQIDVPDMASNVEIAIRLTSDAELAALNFQYRGIDKPTNVLSFAALDSDAPAPPGGIPVFLGDIAIAAETVRREAQEQSKSVSNHLAHMVVHGTLHLLGFDHETETDAAEMENLEREILLEFGIEDPYADQELLS